MSARNKKTTLSGINKSNMHKICQFAFRDDFVSIDMDIKKMLYVVLVTEDVSKDKIDDFQKYFPQSKILTVVDRSAAPN